MIEGNSETGFEIGSTLCKSKGKVTQVSYILNTLLELAIWVASASHILSTLRNSKWKCCLATSAGSSNAWIWNEFKN